MPKLEDIIANKKDYPDEQTIKLGDTELTLGELRGGYMKDADYRQKTSTLAREREEFHRDYAAKQAALEDTKKQVQALADSVAQRAAPNATPDEIEAEIERNPIAKRLNDRLQKELSEMKEVLTPMARTLVAMDKQMKDAAVAATANYHRQALADIISKDPSIDPKALIEHAQNNRMPNLYQAARDFTREAAIEKAKEEGRKAGLEEGKVLAKKESLAPSIPIRRAPVPLPGNEKILNLDEAGEAAKQDMDIMGPLMGIGN